MKLKEWSYNGISRLTEFRTLKSWECCMSRSEDVYTSSSKIPRLIAMTWGRELPLPGIVHLGDV